MYDQSGWRAVLTFLFYLGIALLVGAVITAIVANETGATDRFIQSYGEAE